MSDLNPSLKIGTRASVKPSTGQEKRVAKKTAPTIPPENDVVRLSTASRSPATGRGGEIRRDVVEKYKSMLGDGNYQIKAEEIADKMVQKIRENKGPSVF